MVMQMSRTADAVRAEVQAWIDQNWDPKLELPQWRARLVDSGWGMPHWPSRWFGKDLSLEVGRVVAEEFAKVRAIGIAPGMATWLAAPTILEHGTDEQRERFLRPAMVGEHVWCQLFSEPGNGSDLAGVQTTAVRSGDEWIVNGQKVWTSGAVGADFGMLVARTDWDVPKHQGLSYFALPMKQDGVEVRPLRQMNRQASFNEVFFTDARVSNDNLIGGEGNGWKVALTTLMNERAGAATNAAAGGTVGTQPRASAQREVVQGLDFWQIADLAKKAGLTGDPVLRQRLALIYLLEETSRLNSLRARAAAQAGRQPGPEGSLGKLRRSDIRRAVRDTGMAILGAGGMLDLDDAPANGAVQMAALSASSASIAGGTDEIQRNILGERILGLPKEPQVDRDMPFKEVRQNPTKR